MKRAAASRESGFALAALIFFLTAATILIAAAIPSYQMQAKRAQEEELIFRGEEYMRAIAKYQRKVGIYPPSLDALLETNGIRFLRKAYLDPITGKPFRLIFINPDGTVSGSTLYSASAKNNPAGNLGGAPIQGQNPGQQNLQNAQGAQAQQFGQAQRGQAGQAGQPGQAGQQGGAGQFRVGGGASGQPAQRQQQNAPGQPAFGNTGSGTSGIIGVASESELEGVKTYNNQTHYNQWEFIAVLNQPNPQQQQQPGQQNPNPNQNQQPGQQNQGNRGNLPNVGINGATPGFGGSNMPRPNPNPIPNQPFGFGAPQPQQPQTPRRPN